MTILRFKENMKKYLEKTTAEKVDDDVKFLTDYHREFGFDKLIALVAERHTFITTRALKYRRQLERINVNIEAINDTVKTEPQQC